MKYPKILFSAECKKRFLKHITVLGLVILIAAAATLSTVTVKIIKTGSAFIQHKSKEYVVILDAGHGGFDGGAVVGDIFEKDINLKISNKLCYMLKMAGFKVITTRTDDSSTESDSSLSISAKKKSDLRNRLAISNEYPEAVFLSIHLNKYSSAAPKGAQMFFSTNNENSEILAETIRKSIVNLLQENNTRQIKKGSDSAFILKFSKIPTVIIECGFMSNPEELKNLLDDKYQTQIAFAIFCGVLDYYNI